MTTSLVASVLAGVIVLVLGATARACVRLLAALVHVAADHEQRITTIEGELWGSSESSGHAQLLTRKSHRSARS